MTRIYPDRRSHLAVVALMFWIGSLIAVYGQSKGPSTAAVDSSTPRRGGTSPAVQLEPPSEEVKLGGEDIAEEPVKKEWVEPGAPESIPLLARYLRSRDEVVQVAALADLAGMGPKAKKAAPAIVKALHDPKSFVRVEAAVTLIHLNVQARAAVATLAKELCSEDPAARADAARAVDQLANPPQYCGTSCWGPDPPPRIARRWVKRAVKEAVVRGQ